MLEWLNTPKGHGFSPAEVLYGFPFRSIIPAAFHSYAKYWKDKFKKWDETISTLKRVEKEYYNKQAKPLIPLRIGQKVRIQDPTTKKWEGCGDIIGIGKHRGYYVRLPNGRVYWRNRRFVRPAVINESDEDDIATTSMTVTHPLNEECDSTKTPKRITYLQGEARGTDAAPLILKIFCDQLSLILAPLSLSAPKRGVVVFRI